LWSQSIKSWGQKDYLKFFFLEYGVEARAGQSKEGKYAAQGQAFQI